MAVTEKQARLAEVIASPDQGHFSTKKDLLISVGYAPLTAQTRPNELFCAKGVREALIAKGITPEKLITPATDALQAKQGSWYQGEYYENDAPDHAMRMKGADQLAEILGLKKTVVENRNVNVNVDFQDIGHLFE